MCYATSLRKTEKEIQERFYATQRINLLYEPYYYQSGFEHSNLYIVPQDYPEEIYPAMWGLVPGFALKNIPKFYKDYNTLNARSENIFSSRTYGDAIKNKRCLIIADGFFEPHHRNNISFPHFCHLKDDSLFAFAGVCSEIDDGEYSCSILTTQANGFFAKIHNVKKRMPLVLNSEFEEEWLRSDLSEENIKELMRVGFTTDEFEAYPVSRDLNKRGEPKDVPWAISKVDYPELGGQNTLFD